MQRRYLILSGVPIWGSVDAPVGKVRSWEIDHLSSTPSTSNIQLYIIYLHHLLLFDANGTRLWPALLAITWLHAESVLVSSYY